jgi:hypothetical protein
MMAKMTGLPEGKSKSKTRLLSTCHTMKLYEYSTKEGNTVMFAPDAHLVHCPYLYDKKFYTARKHREKNLYLTFGQTGFPLFYRFKPHLC